MAGAATIRRIDWTYAAAQVVVRGDFEPRLVDAAWVDTGFFETLRPTALAGAPGTAGGAVLGADLARRLFPGARSSGQRFEVAGSVLDVAAELPHDVAFPNAWVEVWLPEAGAVASERDPSSHLRMVVRLRRGASPRDFEVEARRALVEIRGDAFLDPRAGAVTVVLLEKAMRGDRRPAALAAGAAAALVLAVVCGNPALFLLGRAAPRRRLTAVRLALGARRFEALRGAFAEALILVAGGLLLGQVLARALLQLALRYGVDAAMPVGLSAAASALVVVVVLGTAVVVFGGRFELAPALRGGRGVARTGRGVAALVALQIAVSMVLLVGAGLLARTVDALLDEDLGVEAARVLVAELHRGHALDSEKEQRIFADRLLEAVRGLRGVDAAGLGSDVPPVGTPFQVYIRRIHGGLDEGRPIALIGSTPGFLEALGARLEDGRLLERRDAGDASVLLSRSAASFLLAEGAGAGHRMHRPLPPVVPFDDPPRVLGLVGDVRYLGIDEPAKGAVYLPWRAWPSIRSYLAVRTSGDLAALEPALRAVLRQVDPQLPRPEIATLAARVEASLDGRRATLWAAMAFAGVAFGVAFGGVVALFLRLTAERRREFAIRLALGATPGGVVRLVLASAARLAAAGLVLGAVLSAWTGAGLRHLLYGVDPFDPATVAAAAFLLGVASLLAAYLPARAMRRVAPAEVLRDE